MTMLFVLKYEDRFFSLVFRHNGVFAKSQNINLTQGNVVSGSFYSPEDNLGSVSFLFNSHNRVVRDTVRFRIKERNNLNWYYKSDYNTAAFFGLPQYPFGFPLIKNSNGKEYYFEIESLNGTSNNHISIGIKNQHIESKHVFSRKLLSTNTQEIYRYMNKKIINLLKDRDVIYAIVVNMLPLIFFLFISYIDKKLRIHRYFKLIIYAIIINWLKNIIKYIPPNFHDSIKFEIRQFKKNHTKFIYKWSLLLIMIILIFWDIFFNLKTVGFIVGIISIMWIVVSREFEISYKISLFFALLLLFILPITLLFEMVIEPQKIGLWIYILLICIYFVSLKFPNEKYWKNDIVKHKKN